MRKHNMNRFLFMGNTTLTRPSTLNLTAGRGLSFFSQIERKYRVRHSFEKFTLYFLHLANQPDTPIVEHRFVFKPVFRWTLLNRVENYFPTLKWTTQTSMSPGNRIERLNTSFLTYLTRSLSPELTRFLTQLLTRSFSRSTSFTFTSLLHERKSEKSEKGITRETRETREREREREYTTLIHHSPDTAAERIRADIFKWAAPTPLDAPPSASSVPPGQPAYYLNKCLEAITRITSQSNAQTINRLITPSLSRSLTPALTRSLTQLLTRSFSRSSSFTFTSLLHERKREIKGERERERIIRERERERPIEIGIDPTTGKETRNWETANYTYLIHQTPYTADIADIAETAVERVERIRTDIFNYFSTFGRITSQSATAAINRMITTSLTRSLTPSLTQSLTQLLNRSFNLSTSFTTLTTLLHTEKRETKSERVIPYTADIADIAHTSVERVERIRAGIFKWAAPTPLDAPPSASSIPPGQPAYYLNKYLEAITKITSQSSAETINRMITTSLSRSLTPALTQSLSQLLNRSFSRSTTFTTPPPVPGTGTQFTFPITGTISGVSTAGTDYTTLIYQRPYTADIAETADIAYTSVERVERIQADIFNYFATFSRMTSQSASETINRMITTSLLRSLTPTLTQSLNQLLNRSFNRSTTFTTPPPVPGTGTQFTFPITTTISGVSTAGTDYTTLIHQTPYTIDGTDIAEAAVKGGERIERIRADIFNYFTTFSRMTSQSAAETINRMITTSLSPSLTPALTQSLTQLLNRSFNRSTSFTTFTTLLREEKRETKNERVIRDREKERPIEIGWETTDYTYLTHKIPHSADSAAERGERRERGKRTRADIANYFAVFNRMTSQSAAETINRMITTSLAPSLTPALTQSLTQLLNRSFNRSTSFTTFTTLLREEKRETKNERVIRDRERERPIEIGWETTDYTYLTHKIPHSTDTAAERGERGERRERGERGKRTRADIANYFAVFNRMTSQSAAATLNRMITTSLSRSLTPTLTRSLTQLLNRSFTGSTSLTTPTTHTTPATHLREEKREIKSERIRDIFNYFSTLDKVAARTSAASITQLITTSLSRSTQSPTPTPAQPLNRLLTRSLDRSTSFTTLLHEEIKEIKNERIREKETRDRRDRETTNYTTLIHQSPYTTYTTDTADTAYTAYTSDAAERTRTDIFNYFSTLSTLNNITSRAFAASINRLIAPSLTRSLTPGLTMSVTQLLTRSFSTSASSTTNLFSTLRPSPFIFQRIAAPASGASFTPAITPSLTRSFNHAAAFITYLIQKGNGEKEISPVTLTSLSAPSTQSETAATSTPATPRSYGEALKNKVPMPEVPGFERERLEFRHTSAFNLAGKQEAREAHTPQKVRPLVMPAKEWLSSRTVTDKIREPRGAGMDPPGERAAAGPLSPLSPLSIGPRAIDLRSLTGDGDKDPGRRPSMMRHADHAENRLSEDRIKKIEQTIAVQKKQFETRMKDTVVSSASSIASGISPGIPKGMDIARLTDNIYNLLVDKVKRERRMMGY